MSRREKLFAKMIANPGSVRFSEIDEGFILFNSRGSHRTYHRADGRLLTVVRPHGGRSTCHPSDVRKILEAIKR